MHHDDRSSTTPPVLAARPSLMRALNEQMLLEQIRRLDRVSRSDLVEISGLSKPTVAVALTNLEKVGLIRVAGRTSGRRGRAPSLYQLRPEAGFVLGLDVGREYVRGAIADLSGAVRGRGQRKVHPASSAGRVSELVALADELVATVEIKRSLVTQTVIGSPGIYDPRRDALFMARGLPGWQSPHVLTELRRAFGEDMVVENDINLAALAERDVGTARGVQNFGFLSVGTGVGLGLILEGKLHRGSHGAAGEIAFMTLGSDGSVDPKDARRRGWLDSAASAAGVVRAARQAKMSGVVTARRIFETAERGDVLCERIVADEANLIARAIASITAVVDLDLVVLGGGIGQADYFVELVKRELRSLVRLPIAVRASALGEDAVVQGSLAVGAEHAWQRVMRR
ncbi:MAG: ROK family protein [Acidimicrobiales bacterium]|jgi:predicted NBD/HSP70 family sugar kinase